SADPAGSDALVGWAYGLRDKLGAEISLGCYSAVAVSGAGWGNVPSIDNNFRYLWNGQARPTSPAPDLIVLEGGTNDGTVASSTFIANYTQLITDILAFYPTSKLALMQPFRPIHAADIQAAMAAVGSGRVTYIPTTGMFNTAYSYDALHPYGFADQSYILPALTPLLQQILSTSPRHFGFCAAGAACQ
ncbi:MAG: hypothetical protein ACRYHQ_31580, partial [Janthinobacterium lividum]